MLTMSSLIVIFTILIFSSAIFAVEFECDFRSEFGEKYGCFLVKGTIKTKLDVVVTRIQGHHRRYRKHEHIKIFHSMEIHLKYFPRNLNYFFPNINEVFFECGLSEIHKEDIGQFPQLEWLYMSYNEIEVLEKNLFIYNPKLRLIFFDNNRIKFIDSQVFDNLINLEHLSLRDNICNQEHIEGNRTTVVNFIQNIKRSCSTPKFFRYFINDSNRNLEFFMYQYELKAIDNQNYLRKLANEIENIKSDQEQQILQFKEKENDLLKNIKKIFSWPQ